MATNLSAEAASGAAETSNLAPAGSAKPATNLSGSKGSTGGGVLTDAKAQVEHFFDEEVLSKIEDRKVMGAYITRQRAKGIVACVIVLVIILSVVGVMMVGGGGDKAEIPSATGASGSDVTTGVTGGDVTTGAAKEESAKPKEESAPKDDGVPDSERYEVFLELVAPLVGTVVTNETTAEHRALKWLAEEDPAKLSTNAHIDQITQRYVLATLFESMNGAQWADSEDKQKDHHFKSKKHVCEWNLEEEETGIYCDPDDKVSVIELPSLNLDGTIPIDIGLLTNLVHVSFEDNNLKGTLPSSVGLFRKLTSLNVAVNRLTGSIPANSQSKIEGLEELFLQNNLFTGPIPYQVWGSATELREINFSSNQFETVQDDQINDVFSMNKLISVDFSNNLLRGTLPQWLRRLESLEVLKLNDNSFEGTIQKQFRLAPNLQYLDLSNNGLTGTIPPELGEITTLVAFLVRNNGLTGKVAPSLSSPTNMEVFDISGNGLDGTIPTEFGNMKHLQILRTALNGMGGPIPTEIGHMSSLINLDLSRNNMVQKIPTELGRCGSLETLYLNGNRLNGQIPAELYNLPRLERLRLSDNFFFGELDEVFCARPDDWSTFAEFEADCLNDDLSCTCCTSCCDGEDSCCPFEDGECKDA